MKDNKVLRIILIAAAAVWAGWSIVTGIIGLSKTDVSPLSKGSAKGSVCEFKAIYAKEIYNIDHRLMMIFPLGTERYYIAVSENDELAPVLVKASKAWFENNFGDDGIAKSEVTITGEIRRFSSRSRNKLSEVNRELALADSSLRVSEALYLDVRFKLRNSLRIAVGALSLSAGIVLAIVFKAQNISHKAVTVMLIYVSAAVILSVVMALWLEII